MDISKTRSPIEPSPALTHATVQSTSSDNSLNLDLTLASAVDALVQHLVGPLATQGPHLTILDLREHLVRDLTELFEASWDEQHPQIGSGFRSLICTKQLGLPRVLRDAAANVGVDEEIWRRALSVQRTGIEGEERIKEEWEVWCDPGTVVWRSGGWEWEDVGYESLKIARSECLDTVAQ